MRAWEAKPCYACEAEVRVAENGYVDIHMAEHPGPPFYVQVCRASGTTWKERAE